jgi:hypothetical protein
MQMQADATRNVQIERASLRDLRRIVGTLSPTESFQLGSYFEFYNVAILLLWENLLLQATKTVLVNFSCYRRC